MTSFLNIRKSPGKVVMVKLLATLFPPHYIWHQTSGVGFNTLWCASTRYIYHPLFQSEDIQVFTYSSSFVKGFLFSLTIIIFFLILYLLFNQNYVFTALK